MDFCVRMASQVMLNEITSNKDGSNSKNVVLSPLSINMVLNMLASGSSGKTSEQFLDILGSRDLNDLNSNSSTIMSLLVDTTQNDTVEPPMAEPVHIIVRHRKGLLSVPNKRQGKAPVFNLVNALWVDHRYPLIHSYKEITNTIYKAQVKNVDLVHEAEQVKKEVNSWAAKETKGLIKEIVPQQSKLSPPLCLANALYFKGDWVSPFDTKVTRDEDFHLLNGKTTKVPFMSEYYKYRQYGSFKDFKLLKLSYETGQCKSKQFSMYIFLPHANDGLKDLIEKFNSDPTLFLQPTQFSLREQELSMLKIPKMKFTYDFDVQEHMKVKGLTLPFDPLHADFTNMVDPRGVFVDSILHKACIEVNEEGTEAAAVTGARMMTMSLKPSFVADHPFMFMIVEDFSKLVVFTGAVVNPLLD
ncbi:hypothetical protein L484_021839 [Morus notabilis]|uniref:Serpin domain-containing protein n=1 Tax=Morus notabilis TaxID=981085 RepID=W9QQ86_9ROSA|nr:serpin-ZX [Morus notabilis]EXB37633.1 hypothetical protein L484_021839 [Morus notabilis]